MSRYRALFEALDEIHRVQTCLASIGELAAPTDSSDPERDRLSTLLGFLSDEMALRITRLRQALRALDD